MPNPTHTSANKDKIELILEQLDSGERTVTPLPHNGYLHLEHKVPAILIYRKKSRDKATYRLARTAASYLILGQSDADFYELFLTELTKKMAARFASYFLFEIFSGPEDSSEFIIYGNQEKLPITLETLETSLTDIHSRKYGEQLSVTSSSEADLEEDFFSDLISPSKLRTLGGTYVSLQVPPVYRDNNGELYPVYFKQFREKFALAIKKSIFEFVRVQTSSKLVNYNALGKREIHEEVYKIDRQLAEIQRSYQFLLLVAPVNIQNLRKKFFSNNFKSIGQYHYRLLPIDPDILKRRLYNLPIDQIDDPALSYLYDEKRAEIDQELTMLKERGSKNFFYSSIRLYKGIEPNVLEEAKIILNRFPKDQNYSEQTKLNVHQFADLAQKEFEYFRGQSGEFQSKVHIRDDVNVMMVSNGELYLPSDYTLTHSEAIAFIQHEIGTHALTYFNGSKQQLEQMAVGFADYDALQEGIAVLSEFLIGGLSVNRLRILAGRVIAGQALMDGANFVEVFNVLFDKYQFTKEHAFNITSRIFQGGGFLKDIIYLTGLVELREYLIDEGDLKTLLAGKFALKHVEVIKDLTDRGLLVSPTILPRYIASNDFEHKMNDIKQELELSKMVQE